MPKKNESKSATRDLNEARNRFYNAQGALNTAEMMALIAHGWKEETTNLAVGLYWKKKSGKVVLIASRREAMRIEDIA